MNIRHTHRSTLLTSRRAQGGAALVVGLILLVVLTLLAISGMNTSTIELQMAGNVQYSENAFQAAERGIDLAMESGSYNTNEEFEIEETEVPDSDTDTYSATMRFNEDNGVTAVPSGGFSMGTGAGFQAYHFDIESVGASSRNATATHTQSFYIVGPSGT